MKAKAVSKPPVAAWPADKVERRRVSDLVPYARNARTHSAAQVAKIAKSIEQFGWTIPVLLEESGGIIAGHGRIMAAKKLGIETAPCMTAVGWTDAQKRAYVIADNRLALEGGWDEALLSGELSALQDLSFDLGFTGFDSKEIDALFASMASARDADPEATPDPPAMAVSRLGDVWILGAHRLVCGDSTKPETVALALAGAKPHLMVTDPPYGVDYDPEWRNRAARKSPGMGDRHIGAGAVGVVHNDDRADWTEAWKLFAGDVAYVWHGGAHAAAAVHATLIAAGFAIRAQIIWAKQQFAIGRGDYHWQHEPCWYAVRQGAVGHWVGDRKQSTLWAIDKPAKSETGHSTQKPVECMKRPIENNSRRGDAVYEPFAGSSTTIIAAEMTGRRCLAIELSPTYVDVGVLRWEQFSGGKAVLEGTKKTFAAVARERAKEAP